MNTVFLIMSIFGISFLIKESDGPFDIMSRLRGIILRNSLVGVFFYKLLSCYFCVGCHAGWIVYLLQMTNFKLTHMILWSFAGGAISLFGDKILSKLTNSIVD